MSLYICSLIRNISQEIPSGQYTTVRFPFGSAESWDGHGMHQVIQPDGYEVTDWDSDPRSGLIWPTVSGWGNLDALVYWEDGSYSEYRSRFVRDPLGLAGGYDSTCTEDNPPTPGGQYRAKHWAIFVHPGTPLAFLVKQNSGSAVELTHAQFKLEINTDLAPTS